MGSMETTSYVGDYKAFDGQLIPTKSRQAAMGMEQVLTVKNIEWKIADPAIFAGFPQCTGCFVGDECGRAQGFTLA